MSVIRKTFDGGLSDNLFFDIDTEKPYVHEKGYDRWMTYRKEWEQYCNLEIESEHPPHLEFELNYSCNLRCPMCTWSAEKAVARKVDWFSFEDYQKVIDEAVEIGTKSIRLCYINEPLIRNDIDQFVEYAVRAGILDVIITSNGTLLTERMSEKLINAGLTKLNVSLDATTEDTYNKIRVGGDFNKTVKNIEKFLEVRKRMDKQLPTIRLTFVSTKLNHFEQEDFVERWKDKVDGLGIQQVQNVFGRGKFENESQAEVVMINKKIDNSDQYRCPEPFKRIVLRSNGDVLPCCSFYGAELVIGNWHSKPLKSIWNSEQMREMRDLHKKGDFAKNSVCAVCVNSWNK